MASISCEYLEELYLEQTLSNCNNQSVQEVVRQFDSRANEAIDKYLDTDKTHSHKIREFLLVNDNQGYPYFVMLLLFRAALHKEAIWYAS